MKKILIALALVFALILGGCNACAPTTEPEEPAPTTYTVAFEVDGSRYLTKRVEAGGSVTGTVANPSKDGYDFDFWTLNGAQVDVFTYVVNSDVTFVAQFTAISSEPEEPEQPEEPDTTNYFNIYIQVYSTNLTQAEAETFKSRFEATLSADELALTRFHIETGDSTVFKPIIENAADVDAVIGGNNPLNSFTAHADGPITNVAAGHFASTNRKVIIYGDTDSLELAAKLYAFATTEYVDPSSAVIDLTVTVHGDTDAITHLTDGDTLVTIPNVTIADGKEFKGWATTADGDVELNVLLTAELKYNDVKDLVEGEATTLELYPVIRDIPTVNPGFSLYIQVNGNYLTQTEAETLRDRFLATLSADEQARVICHIEDADKTTFAATITGADDVDAVVGGNDPLKNFTAHADGPLANAGTGHFASTNRKVIIYGSTNDLDLATKLYNFVTGNYVAEAE